MGLFDRGGPIRLNLNDPEDGPEVKVAAPQTGLITLNLGLERQGARPMGTDPKRLLTDGFGANVTVYGCVMGWARAVSGLSWYLLQKPKSRGSRVKKKFTFATAAKAMATSAGRKSVEQAEIEDHPLLLIRERPNPTMRETQFDESYVAYLMSTGNTYVELVRASDQRVVQVWGVRPDLMKVVPGRDRMPAGYLFTPGDGQKDVPFDTSEIDHLKLFAALSEWYGMSPMAAAARAIDSDNEAMRWAHSMLVNDMRPPGAFVAKTNLSDPSFDRLKKQMREKFQGARNAGKPLVLDNGLEWISFAMTPAEVDWIRSRENWRRDICAAYNYGSELLGDAANKTFANRKEALHAHYTENALPMANHVRDVWNTRVVQTWGDDLYLDYDRDQIEVLQEDREKLWMRVEGSRFLTVNEKREATGYPTVPDGDVILVSSGDVPLDMLGETVRAAVVEGEVVEEDEDEEKPAKPGKDPRKLPKGDADSAEAETTKALARLERSLGRLKAT